MRVSTVPSALAGVLVVAVLIGCGSGAPATTPATNTPAPTLAQPTPGGGPATAEGLCQAVTAELAVAALGGAVDAPQSGDVVPRPNGVYCHYNLAGNANTNVNAQLREMSRDEFESLAELMSADTPVAGVGEAAFRRESSSLGGGGSSLVAWSGGHGVTVVINREGGDQALMNAAAEAIASAALTAAL